MDRRWVALWVFALPMEPPLLSVKARLRFEPVGWAKLGSASPDPPEIVCHFENWNWPLCHRWVGARKAELDPPYRLNLVMNNCRLEKLTQLCRHKPTTFAKYYFRFRSDVMIHL